LLPISLFYYPLINSIFDFFRGKIFIIKKTEIQARYSYNSVIRDENNSATTRWCFDPVLLAGFDLRWNVNDLIFVNAGPGFGLIFEKHNTLKFITLSAGVGLRF
jgi:hypothetical protein